MIRNAASRRAALVAVVLGSTFCLALLAPASAWATRSIGISAPSFNFNVASGQSGQGDIEAINDGTEPIRVMVYAANQVTDASGTVDFEVPQLGTPSYEGPATWITIKMPASSKAIGNVPYVDLAPHQRVQVHFSFTVPPGVPAGDHQVLIFFEMFGAAKTGATVSVSGRVGSRLHVRVQGTLVQKMSVQPFAVRNLVIGDLMSWDFVVRNDGNIDKTVNGTLELLDSNEDVLQSSVVCSDVVLYANTTFEKSGTMRLTRAGIGQYTARLTVTYPTEPDAQGQTTGIDIVKDRTVWVFPLWLVIAVIAVVGLLVLWVTWRQAVRAAERKLAKQKRKAQPGSSMESSI
jgi:hypothetical protein